jgi:hypothetical protein
MTAPGVPATQTMNEDPVLARRFRNATPRISMRLHACPLLVARLGRRRGCGARNATCARTQ